MHAAERRRPGLQLSHSARNGARRRTTEPVGTGVIVPFLLYPAGRCNSLQSLCCAVFDLTPVGEHVLCKLQLSASHADDARIGPRSSVRRMPLASNNWP